MKEWRGAGHEDERRGMGPFLKIRGALPFPPRPPVPSMALIRSGNESFGAFPFPPHPPSHDEPPSQRTDGEEQAMKEWRGAGHFLQTREAFERGSFLKTREPVALDQDGPPICDCR
jgi:hypothetical protein